MEIVENIASVIGLAVMGFVIVALIAALLEIPTMLFWNYVVPPVFGLTTINFFQALALNGLAGIFFYSGSASKSK